MFCIFCVIMRYMENEYPDACAKEHTNQGTYQCTIRHTYMHKGMYACAKAYTCTKARMQTPKLQGLQAPAKARMCQGMNTHPKACACQGIHLNAKACILPAPKGIQGILRDFNHQNHVIIMFFSVLYVLCY